LPTPPDIIASRSGTREDVVAVVAAAFLAACFLASRPNVRRFFRRGFASVARRGTGRLAHIELAKGGSDVCV
jgi:hypothetical protein